MSAWAIAWLVLLTIGFAAVVSTQHGQIVKMRKVVTRLAEMRVALREHVESGASNDEAGETK